MTEKHEPARASADPTDPPPVPHPDDAGGDRRPVGFDLVPAPAGHVARDEPGNTSTPADEVMLFDDSADPVDFADTDLADTDVADTDTLELVPAARGEAIDGPDTIGLAPADGQLAFGLAPVSGGLPPEHEPVPLPWPTFEPAAPSASVDRPAAEVAPAVAASPSVVGGVSTTDWLAARPADEHPADVETPEPRPDDVDLADLEPIDLGPADAEPAGEATDRATAFTGADSQVTNRLAADEQAAEDLMPEMPADAYVPAAPTLLDVAVPPPLPGEPTGTTHPDASPIDPTPQSQPPATDEPALLDVEPSGAEMASIPIERDEVVPLAAVAAATLVTAAAGSPEAAHDPTDAEVYAHAHDDVAYRDATRGWGYVTRFAGLAGLVACAAGLAMMFVACAGLAPATDEALVNFIKPVAWFAGGMAAAAAAHVALAAYVWRSGWAGAIVTAAVAAVAVALAAGLWQFHARVAGFNVLSLSCYVAYVGAGGLVLAVVGGLIEHRRMREETHVLAAVFANVLAGVGGALLYAVYQNWNIIAAGAPAAQ